MTTWYFLKIINDYNNNKKKKIKTIGVKDYYLNYV